MIRLCHCQHNGDREGETKCSDSPGNPVVWLSCSGIAASNPRALSNQCRILVFLSGLWCATAPTWTKGWLRIRRLAVEQIWTPMQTLPVKLSGVCKSQDCPQTPSIPIPSNPHNLRWSVEVHRSSFLSPSIARSMCCKHGLLPTATSSKLGAGACEGFSFFRSGPLPAARFCGGRTGHKMVTNGHKSPKKCPKPLASSSISISRACNDHQVEWTRSESNLVCGIHLLGAGLDHCNWVAAT